MLVNVFVSKMLMVIVVIVARKDSSTCSKIIFLVVNVSVEADGDNVALVMEVWMMMVDWCDRGICEWKERERVVIVVVMCAAVT